ncbi:MAG: TlpA family protein disulfide reductase [Oscillochloris sp.]|nr:TlpA family protein disulfide reductase [Oscillochloris sp.]
MGQHRLLLLLLGATLLAACGLPGGDSVQSGVQEGMRLPDAEFTRLDGTKFKVSDLRGMPAVINFWATWCGPCTEEIPVLQAAYRTDQGSSFQLIAISEETKHEVDAFMQGNALDLPVAIDPGGHANQRYHIQGIPTTFFLDSNGVIVIRHTGSLTPHTFQTFLAAITDSDNPQPTITPAPTPAPTRIPIAPPTPNNNLIGQRRADNL